jgi:hypothetical protein
MRGREERSLGVTPDRGIGEFLSRVARPMFCRAGVAGRNRPARRGSGRRAVRGWSEGKAFPHAGHASCRSCGPGPTLVRSRRGIESNAERNVGVHAIPKGPHCTQNSRVLVLVLVDGSRPKFAENAHDRKIRPAAQITHAVALGELDPRRSGLPRGHVDVNALRQGGTLVRY